MEKTKTSPHYRTQILESLCDSHIAKLSHFTEQWDALVNASDRPSPFLKFTFISALEKCQCTTTETGWTPHFLLLWEALEDKTEVLVGAVPLYLKQHSYGEYVFDWSWAEAWERTGQDYYPKLLSAIPFSPIPGPRLLANSPEAKAALWQALLNEAKQLGVSSLHILFNDNDDLASKPSTEVLLREGVQFHWQNQGFTDFENFLASLNQKKRKNIRAERRQVAEAGVSYRHIRGTEATDDDWIFFYTCYANTYLERRSRPYLTLDFFRTLAQEMPEQLHLIIAIQNHQPIAAAFLMLQTGESGTLQGGTAYGRYWGATLNLACLHFETAYYQAIEFCIAQGIQTLQGGAQGEHKMARGFLPVKTYSLHWLADERFREAVARFLKRESAEISHYQSHLEARTPFKLL